MGDRAKVPWFWWVRLAVSIGAVVLFAVSGAQPAGVLGWLALFGIGFGAAVLCDLTRWSYRQAIKADSGTHHQP